MKRNSLTADLFALQIQQRSSLTGVLCRETLCTSENNFLISCYNSVSSIDAERTGLRECALSSPAGIFERKEAPLSIKK